MNDKGFCYNVSMVPIEGTFNYLSQQFKYGGGTIYMYNDYTINQKYGRCKELLTIHGGGKINLETYTWFQNWEEFNIWGKNNYLGWTQ